MYGSVNNRVSERVFQMVPVVGMGATLSLWSDRQAYTVLEVSDDKVIYSSDVRMSDGTIQNITREYPKYIIASEDEYKVISGSMYDGSAEFEFTTRQDGREKFVFHKKTGIYRKENTNPVLVDKGDRKEIEYIGTGRTSQKNTPLLIGSRSKYYDPSF